MQLAGRYREQRLQPAVAVDPQGLVMLAAVGLADPAGMALLAVDIGLYTAAVTGADVLDTRPDFLD